MTRGGLVVLAVLCGAEARRTCVCPNGVPVFGAACTLDGATRCMYCSNGYHLTRDHACAPHQTCGADEYMSFAGSSFSDAICQKKLCTCAHGVPTVGAACATHGAASCASCTGARHLEAGDTKCELNSCHCDNGTPPTSSSGHCTAHNANICADCNTGFHFMFSTGTVALTDDGYSPDVLPLGNCQGDCDRDDHCASGYVCYQNNYHTVIPGCSGAPKEAMDYCVKATDECEAHTECDFTTHYTSFAGTSKLDRECAPLTTCQPGSYVKTPNTETSNRVCAPCPPNTFSATANAASCTAHTSCDLGEYETRSKSATRDRLCDKCAPGFFSDYRNALSCMACDHANTYSHQPLPGQSECKQHEKCPAGQQLVDYSDTDAGMCTACDAGSFKSSRGSTPYATCSRCYRGRYSASGATTCTKCAAGTYQNQYGQGKCVDCPKGRFVEVTGRTSLGHCDYCPSGKYADKVGTVHCTACDKGSMGVVAVNNNHANHCVACEKGKYQQEDGSTHCAECESGTYAPTGGHSGCLSCDVANGEYTGGKIDDHTYYWTENKAGATECTKHPRDCKPNPWVGAWNTCTLSCGGGVQQETRTPMWVEWGEGATACPAFQWTREQDCNVHPCPIDCVWGQWGTWSHGVGGCSKSCGGGINSRSRSVQVPHKYGGKECLGSKDDTPACKTQPCPVDCVYGNWGAWSADGTGSGPTCTAPCNGGRQTRTRTTTEPSFGGKACPSATAERDCQTQCCKGHFHNRAKGQTCEKCSAGTFAPQEGVPICTDCPVGTYQPGKGFDVCLNCPKGHHNAATGRSELVHCTACAKGKYAEFEGTEHCADCVEGKYNALEAGDSRNSCFNCEAGQYADSKAAHKCENCPVGKYNDEDTATASPSCKDCAAGRFNKYTGRATEGYCHFCPCGQWSMKGSSVCAHCGLGKYRTCDGNAPQCDGGSSEASCTAASAGFRAHSTGLCKQTKCSPGKFMADQSSHYCTRCAAGKFSAARGATSASTCQVCPAGKWSSSGDTQCTDCVAGKFNAYAQKGAVEYCLDCDAGSYAADAGSVVCTTCETGRFQTAPGMDSCSLCGSGTSNPKNGSKAAADCVDCAKGHFQPDEGKATCIKCSAGEYQNVRGEPSCKHCAAGTYNMFTASVTSDACRQCNKGSYSSAQASVCTPCGIGRASDTLGANTAAHCVHCPAGSFADEQGLAVCKKCSKGTHGVADETGATDGSVHCLKCAKGQFQKYDGATACAKCKADTYTPPHAAGHDMVECIACAVVDSVRRYSTFGVAGADHCDPVPVDCKPSPWGAVTQWSKKQHADLAKPDQAPSGWLAGAWSQCTKSCGGGKHTRTKHPVRMPALPSACGLADQSQCDQAWGGGKACSHPDYVWTETDDCNEHPCPVDCVMEQWGNWHPCTKTCGVGGTYRTRSIKSGPKHGGAACLHDREPLVGLKNCNEHTCSDHPAPCGATHVRCDVKMLEHHKSNFGIRKTLSTCGHTAIEEQNECWNNDNCKSCAAVHSNEDMCNAERCHDADTDSEKAMQAKLEADYQACLKGVANNLPILSVGDTNVHRANVGLPPFKCRKSWPTLQVTHDRENMEQLGKFKCVKTSATTCACHCDRHAPCCASKNKLLSNKMVFGNRFTGVNVLQDCCNMCTNHPECTAWEYTSEKVCILKSGVISAGSYTANPLPDKVTTWAGTPSGVGTC